MKLRIDEKTYEGTGVGILEQLRQEAFEPEEFPDAESYLWQLRGNFMRASGLDCVLPDACLERQSRVLFAHLAKAGALEVLNDG